MITRTLTINAKCSDRFSLSFEEAGKERYKYNGDVPEKLGIGGGDYINLEIDLDTGKIVGWAIFKTDAIKTLQEMRDEAI